MSDIKNKITKLADYYKNALAELGDVQALGKHTKILPEENTKIPQKNIQEQITKITKTMNVTQEKPKNNALLQKAQTEKTVVDLAGVSSIDDLKREVDSTCKCELKQFANKTVFCDGNPNAKILVVGEAPGQEEDMAGIPFCGRSGELLMNAFRVINLVREENIIITNNIFWRPPGNRNPEPQEIEACRPFLVKLAEIIKPEVVICVGSVAASSVLQTEGTISSLRGKVFGHAQGIGIKEGVKTFALYHPSYLLRSPAKKYELYKDLLFIKENIKI